MNQSDDSEMRPAHLAVLSLQGPLREMSLFFPGIKSQGSSGKYLTVNHRFKARAKVKPENLIPPLSGLGKRQGKTCVLICKMQIITRITG